MRWFGEPWGARICDTMSRVETPIGTRCFLCPETIGEDDAGFVLTLYTATPGVAIAHRGCLILSLLGYENGTVPTSAALVDRDAKKNERRGPGRRARPNPARSRRRQPAANVLAFPLSRVNPVR